MSKTAFPTIGKTGARKETEVFTQIFSVFQVPGSALPIPGHISMNKTNKPPSPWSVHVGIEKKTIMSSNCSETHLYPSYLGRKYQVLFPLGQLNKTLSQKGGGGDVVHCSLD